MQVVAAHQKIQEEDNGQQCDKLVRSSKFYISRLHHEESSLLKNNVWKDLEQEYQIYFNQFKNQISTLCTQDFQWMKIMKEEKKLIIFDGLKNETIESIENKIPLLNQIDNLQKTLKKCIDHNEESILKQIEKPKEISEAENKIDKERKNHTAESKKLLNKNISCEQQNSDVCNKVPSNIKQYISLCAKNIFKQYQQLNKYCNEKMIHVKKLHFVHITIIQKKFEKAFSELEYNSREINNHFCESKQQWLNEWQEYNLKWEQKYHDFAHNIMEWIEEFYIHQKAANLLFLPDDNSTIINRDLQPIIETIFDNTSKIREKIKQQILCTQEASFRPHFPIFNDNQNRLNPREKEIIKTSLDFNSESDKSEGKRKNPFKDNSKIKMDVSESNGIPLNYFDSNDFNKINSKNEPFLINTLSYLSYLKTLYEHYSKIEEKYKLIIEEGKKNYKKLWKKKRIQIKQQQEFVDHLKRKITCLEENSNFVRNSILEYGHPTLQQLERDVAIKNGLEKMKPRLQEENLQLTKYIQNYLEIDRILTELQVQLPSGNILFSLQKTEQEIIKTRDIIQTNTSTQFDHLLLKLNQKRLLNFEKFQFYLIQHFELANKEHIQFETQLWNEFEHQAQLIKPELFMLQKNLLQYQEECIELFGKENFDLLEENIQNAWIQFLNTYKKRRLFLHEKHIDLYIEHLNHAMQRIKALKLKLDNLK